MNHSEKLKRAWVTRRKNGNSAPINKTPTPPKDELVRLYFIEKKNFKTIGKIYGCKSNIAPRRWFREYGLKPRTTSENLSLRQKKFGEEHHLWKGENGSKATKHAWVKSRLGKPNKCEHCGTTSAKKFEWANKSGQYKRDLTDWLRLCTRCHVFYDKKDNLKEWREKNRKIT